jgi:hypothetical protein
MNVETLLDVLLKNVKKCDRKGSNIQVWLKNKEYEIVEINGFGICSDVSFVIEPVKENILMPISLKKDVEKSLKIK